MAVHSLSITRILYDTEKQTLTFEVAGGALEAPSAVPEGEFFPLDPAADVSFTIPAKRLLRSARGISTVLQDDRTISYRLWERRDGVWRDLGPCDDRGVSSSL